MEKWKKIPGYPDAYEASSLGRIRFLGGTYITTCGKNTRFKGKTFERTMRPKIYALRRLSQKGYQRINLLGNAVMVHRLVLSAFIPNPLNLPQCNHKNGIKTDNRIENLEWTTNYQNRRHAVNNGLQARGPKFLARKYDDTDAAKMKSMLATHSLRAIGRHFRTSHATIKSVLARPT